MEEARGYLKESGKLYGKVRKTLCQNKITHSFRVETHNALGQKQINVTKDGREGGREEERGVGKNAVAVL